MKDRVVEPVDILIVDAEYFRMLICKGNGIRFTDQAIVKNFVNFCLSRASKTDCVEELQIGRVLVMSKGGG